MSNKLKITDLIPGIVSMGTKLPSIIKGGLSTFTLFDNLPLSIGLVLEGNAIRHKNDPAILFENKRYTYGELNQLVNQYAHILDKMGVRRGDIVNIFLENRPETIMLVAALSKLGAVGSLINPNQRGNVLLHSFQIKPVTHCIIGEELLDAFESIKLDFDPSNKHLFYLQDQAVRPCPSDYINLSALIIDASVNNISSTKDIRTKEQFAYVFTSGTTGLPKAAIQTHKKWLRAMNWFGNINGGFTDKDVIYVSIPFYHANALIIGWSSAFANGSALAMRRKFSVKEFWNDIQKFQATAFIYIGEICRYLINSKESSQEKNNPVKAIIGNGMRPEIWQNFKSRFDIQDIYEFYSASDTNLIFTNSFNVEGSVGWCPAEFSVVKYDVDEDAPTRNSKGFMEKVQVGDVGLLISKVTDFYSFDGYANPKFNEKRIFKDVFVKGDQWLNSGDLMRDIGFKHTQFVDRVGDTFRWKGENVSTAEVEGVINSLDFVESCAVYGVQIPNTDGRAGMAAITTNSDLDLDLLHKTLKEKLPVYARPIFIRHSSTIETTHTQKIKKSDLKKEAYYIDRFDEPVYFSNKGKEYTLLESIAYQQISNGEIKL